MCIDCIKGKQTNIKKVGANKSSSFFELIHTGICGPFLRASWNGQQYFISFIDDYSCYGYLYLIHKKSQSVDVFKSYKVEVENQFGKKIKAIKYDRGGEYYGRYCDSPRRLPDPTRPKGRTLSGTRSSLRIKFLFLSSIKHIFNAHFVNDIYLNENIFVYTNST